ncbi:MAG: hypothetical protein ABGZ36_05615, partial [Actinomycetota bacterium]
LTDDVGNLYETDMAEEYDAEGMINRLGRAYAGHDHPDELTDRRRVRGPPVGGPSVDKQEIDEKGQAPSREFAFGVEVTRRRTACRDTAARWAAVRGWPGPASG